MEFRSGAIVYAQKGESTIIAVPFGKVIPKKVREERWLAVYFVQGTGTDTLPLPLIKDIKSAQTQAYYNLGREAIKQGEVLEGELD